MMFIEPVIFNGENGVYDRLGDILEGDEPSVLISSELADRRAVPEVGEAGYIILADFFLNRQLGPDGLILHDGRNKAAHGAAGEERGHNAQDEHPFDDGADSAKPGSARPNVLRHFLHIILSHRHPPFTGIIIAQNGDFECACRMKGEGNEI
ncbi:hypothetical protein D3C71_1486430 [compost metagenome]